MSRQPLAKWKMALFVALFSSATLLSASPGPHPALVTGLPLSPCQLQGNGEEALCGVLEVFEDRHRRRGRKIPLKVVVMPSKKAERGLASGTDNPASDTSAPAISAPEEESAPGEKRVLGKRALFVLAGGPGVAATSWGPGFVTTFLGDIRGTSDIVFVDQRGTGESNALNCQLYDSTAPSSLWGDLLPIEPIERCRRKLEDHADLRFYGTAFAADDLDDIRAALGYSEIDIYGSSYGSHLAQVYLRRHPHRVRSAVLQGVAPTDARSLEEIPRAADASLAGLISLCAADPGCHQAYPELQKELEAVLTRLRSGPIQVQAKLPGRTRAEALTLTYDNFTLVLRGLLHHPAAAGAIPHIVHAAANGNFQPFIAPSLRYRRALAGSVAFGLFLSIFCEEQVRPADLEAAAEAAVGSFAGDYWTRQLVRACRAWPRGILPPGHDRPVHSQVPVLLISGGLDPTTPPNWARAVASHLPHSRLLEIPHASHSFGGMFGCVDRLIVEFLDSGSAEGLETSCLGDLEPPSFVLP